ncbi:MAG: hypothetical protein ACR2PH_02125, partial [Desulfobulbia bacterium]
IINKFSYLYLSMIEKKLTDSLGFFAKHDMNRLKNLTTNAFGNYSMHYTKMISIPGIEFAISSSIWKCTGLIG